MHFLPPVSKPFPLNLGQSNLGLVAVGGAMVALRYFVAILVLLLAPISASGQTRESPLHPQPYSDAYQSSWAVVIGIDAYQKAPRLNYAVADAKAVATLLPSLGFPKENIRVLLDGEATKAKIESAFYRDLKRMGPNDRLFVYFAGHGETAAIRAGEEGYILPVDADRDALPLTAIAMEDVQRISKRLPAKHYLFVMDACFSGFAITRAASPTDNSKEYLAAALRETVVQVITAGRKGQESIEDGGHGLFTRRFLDGLRGLADTEARGFISAAQLAAWIEPRVIRDSKGKMTPQYGKLDGEGQFIFLLPGSQVRMPAVDLSGTFTGLIEGSVDSRKYSIPVTATFVQRGKSLSGTWTAGAASGTLTGLVDGSTIRAFRVDQANPCSAIFHGLAVSQNNNNALSGSYSGKDCNGMVFAMFRVGRVDREEKLEDTGLEPSDLFNIGLSYFAQQRYDDAFDYFQQSLRIGEKRGDERVEAQALAAIGMTRAAQGNDVAAIRPLEQSLPLFEKLADVRNQALVLAQIGLVHLAQRRMMEAGDHFKRSLALAEKVGDEPQKARLLYNLGLLALQQERYSEALGSFEQAVLLADRYDLPERAQIRQARDEARGKAKQ